MKTLPNIKKIIISMAFALSMCGAQLAFANAYGFQMSIKNSTKSSLDGGSMIFEDRIKEHWGSEITCGRSFNMVEANQTDYIATCNYDDRNQDRAVYLDFIYNGNHLYAVCQYKPYGVPKCEFIDYRNHNTNYVHSIDGIGINPQFQQNQGDDYLILELYEQQESAYRNR